jgi:restriction system protein
MEAKEAFSSLLKLATKELEKVQKEGATYFASGDTTHIREAADQVEKIQELIKALNQLQGKWQQVIPDVAPTLLLPLLEHPIQRTPSGIKTPQEQYRLPILQALVEMGGKGRTGLVLDRVGEIMKDILNDFDRERLPKQRDFRWRNTAMWERLDMVKDGLLSDRSPNGTWEITEKGRKQLVNHGINH